MNKKWIGISTIFIIVLFVIIKLVMFPNHKMKIDDINNDENNSEITKIEEIEWNEITEEGINEDLFLKNLDTKLLEKIASKFQSAIKEEGREEKENPEIILTEGWTRIFNKEQYIEVVKIGKMAMKPLYWILYKSENNGQYEYLCAMALQEISGITFENAEDGTIGWSNAKEYLDLFTKEIIERK